MRIDSARIRAERRQRAWSQQHLAAVTGLGLRTVQRIEKEGTAAYDSAQALAACFELPLQELTATTVEQPGPARVSRHRTGWIGMSAAFVAGAALMSVQWVFADDLLVDVGFADSATGGGYQLQVRMTSGEPTEVLLPGAQRMVITPRVLDAGRQVLFDLSFYDSGDDRNADSERTQPLARPSLVALAGQEARVMIGISDSRARCIALRSSLLAEPVESGADENGVRSIEPLDNDCELPPGASSRTPSSPED